MSSIISHDSQQPDATILDNPSLEDYMIQDFMEYIRYDRDYLMTLSEPISAVTTDVLEMFDLEFMNEDEATIPTGFAVTTRVLEMFDHEFMNEDEATIATGVVPTDDSYVASLEIKKADEELVNSEEVCSVCLEGWNMGDDVKYTPCKHCFHPTCVDKWLNINHFCPLCRFELPVAKNV